MPQESHTWYEYTRGIRISRDLIGSVWTPPVSPVQRLNEYLTDANNWFLENSEVPEHVTWTNSTTAPPLNEARLRRTANAAREHLADTLFGTVARRIRASVQVTQEEINRWDTAENCRCVLQQQLVGKINLLKTYVFQTRNRLNQGGQTLIFFQNPDAGFWTEGVVRPLDRWLEGVFRNRVRIPEFVYPGEER